MVGPGGAGLQAYCSRPAAYPPTTELLRLVGGSVCRFSRQCTPARPPKRHPLCQPVTEAATINVMGEGSKTGVLSGHLSRPFTDQICYPGLRGGPIFPHWSEPPHPKNPKTPKNLTKRLPEDQKTPKYRDLSYQNTKKAQKSRNSVTRTPKKPKIREYRLPGDLKTRKF